MLVLVTLLWGWSFPLVKNWLTMASQTQCPGGEVIAALTNMALRYPLALVLLAVFQFRLYRMPSRRELGIGLFIGLVMSAGSALQVWGLAEATPALSAFLTSLASAWVPLLALGWFKQVIPRLTWLGLALGIGGAAVLARVDGPEGWTLGRGEGLTLAASVLFAVGILLLDRLGRPVPAGHLTVGYLAGTGLPAIIVLGAWAAWGGELGAWLTWTGTMLGEPAVVRDLALLTVFPTVLAFHWMVVYQPRLSAARAALIYLLEPVFAAGFSLSYGLDSITSWLLIGGGLILGGNLLVELPVWLRERRRNTQAVA
jgi:drug/metabolite transporter (DMT)-like permease